MPKRLAKNKPLTYKQKAFVNELIDNPKQPASHAAIKAYSEPGKPLSRASAAVIAYENLKKPQIVSKLAEYNDLIESTLLNTVRDWGSDDAPRKREIALDATKFMHDKIHGRATQKIETQATILNIGIDMTQPAPTEDNL